MLEEKEILIMLKEKSLKQKAFSLIVNEYSKRIYWHIRKMVLSHEDADDLVQNTFIKAWQNIDKFKGNSKIYTWLMRIAINETYTFLNKKRNYSFSSIDDLEDIMINNLKSDEYFSDSEIELKLQKAILTLPDKQRTVFNMKYYDDLKYDQISEILGTSVGALKASYHHAVRKIQAIITIED